LLEDRSRCANDIAGNAALCVAMLPVGRILRASISEADIEQVSDNAETCQTALDASLEGLAQALSAIDRATENLVGASCRAPRGGRLRPASRQ
jgi:hypothetical protein